MKNHRHFDLVVLGAEPCGYVAAACAARAGASCAIVTTGTERPSLFATAAIPNAIWRRLDLHEAEFSAQDVTAHISLFEDGHAVATYPNEKETIDALSVNHPGDGALWTDFRQSMKQVTAMQSDTGDDLLSEFEEQHIPASMQASRTDTVNTVLDDYFEQDALKAHLAAISGMTFGVGGEEPGSVFALASATDDAAWKTKNAQGIMEMLRRICEKHNVVEMTSPVRRIFKKGRGDFELAFELGDEIRASCLMTASTHVTKSLGLKSDRDLSALSVKENAEATINVKLSGKAKPPKKIENGEDAIFYIAESADEIRAARDAVLEGRTPETPPLMFEFGDKEIIVRTPFCPRLIETEDGPREWTGQDRQVLGKQVVDRLSKYLNGSLDGIQRTEVNMIGAGELDPENMLNEDTPVIPTPVSGANDIAAAADLAMRLIDRD